jgi:hypothetical protein
LRLEFRRGYFCTPPPISYFGIFRYGSFCPSPLLGCFCAQLRLKLRRERLRARRRRRQRRRPALAGDEMGLRASEAGCEGVNLVLAEVELAEEGMSGSGCVTRLGIKSSEVH